MYKELWLPEFADIFVDDSIRINESKIPICTNSAVVLDSDVTTKPLLPSPTSSPNTSPSRSSFYPPWRRSSPYPPRS